MRGMSLATGARVAVDRLHTKMTTVILPVFLQTHVPPTPTLRALILIVIGVGLAIVGVYITAIVTENIFPAHPLSTHRLAMRTTALILAVEFVMSAMIKGTDVTNIVADQYVGLSNVEDTEIHLTFATIVMTTWMTMKVAMEMMKLAS